jgi:LysM repeat protein
LTTTVTETVTYSASTSSATSSPDIVNIGWNMTGNYTVEGNDTIQSIAAAYDVGVCNLARANRLAHYEYIYAGQVLVIPGPVAGDNNTACYDTNNTLTTATCISGGPHTYTTFPGDTVQKIANSRFNITVDSIQSYQAQTQYIVNAGPYDVLEAGMNVKIPLCMPSQCIIESFTLEYGTFQDLATTYGSTVGQLMGLNSGYNHSEGAPGTGAELILPLNCTS